jgi:hypothetical protein
MLTLVFALGACAMLLGEDRVAVPTSEPGPLFGQGCPAALAHGRLSPDDRWGVVLDGEFGAQPVRWPNGYYAEHGAELVLRDDRGQLVASAGDTVYVGGGMDANDELFVACGHVGTEPP